MDFTFELRLDVNPSLSSVKIKLSGDSPQQHVLGIWAELDHLLDSYKNRHYLWQPADFIKIVSYNGCCSRTSLRSRRCNCERELENWVISCVAHDPRTWLPLRAPFFSVHDIRHQKKPSTPEQQPSGLFWDCWDSCFLLSLESISETSYLAFNELGVCVGQLRSIICACKIFKNKILFCALKLKSTVPFFGGGREK